LKADSPQASDLFGFGVAIEKDTLAVSSTRSSPNLLSGRAGVVDVFVRNAGVWSRQARVSAPDGSGSDLFGCGVALQGERLVVGAPYESTGARQSGAIYVFERSGGAWGAPSKLKASQPIQEGVLGASVALDGDTVIGGAHQFSGVAPGPSGPGSSYVFVHRAPGWVEQQKLVSSMPVDGGTFGWRVAVVGDTAVVSEPHAEIIHRTTDSGAVYVFDRVGEQWTVSARLEATKPRAADYYGSDIAFSSAALVVGATGDASGSRGPNADAARDDAPQSGAVYVYSRQGNDWSRRAYMKASNAEQDDSFGFRVALHGDTFAVGATGESGGSMGVNGDESTNSLRGSGATYVFR
jgi:hypothetical protein